MGLIIHINKYCNDLDVCKEDGKSQHYVNEAVCRI